MLATSSIAAKICSYISSKREQGGLYKEISQDIISHIKEGNLNEKYDVIILPNDSAPMIIGGDELKKWYKENVPFRTFPNFPPEYRSGIGEEGVENLKKFVEEGGSLVCLGESSDFAIEKLELKVRVYLRDCNPKSSTAQVLH